MQAKNLICIQKTNWNVAQSILFGLTSNLFFNKFFMVCDGFLISKFLNLCAKRRLS